MARIIAFLDCPARKGAFVVVILAGQYAQWSLEVVDPLMFLL